MAHRSTGLYRIFESAVVYEQFQRLLGAHAARKRFVAEVVRPLSGMRILDIGCGPGTMLDYLPHDIDYVGYDPNPHYIAVAKEKNGQRGQFFCARARTAPVLSSEHGFDLVIAKSILHHLDDEEARVLINSSYQHLNPNGHFVTSDPVYYRGQSTVSRLIISLDRGRQVRTPEQYTSLATTRFPAVEGQVVTDMLPIPYSHFLMRARKDCSQPYDDIPSVGWSS